MPWTVWVHFIGHCVGHIPSWLVALVFAGTFITVITITIYVSKKSSGEISEFGTHRSLWRI
jgi:hypothetical protein